MASLRSVIRIAARPVVPVRTFANSAWLMAAGDTGSTRPGGEMSGDAFTKKEKANEDYYIRQQEREKLKALKEKLRQQRQHIDELEQSIDEYTKEQGGENN